MFEDIIIEKAIEPETTNVCGYCESYTEKIGAKYLPNTGWCTQMCYMVLFTQRACQYVKEID